MSEAAALVAAADKGDLATVNSLLATAAGRAAIDVPDEDGGTALMIAALKGHTPVVEALLGAGAAIDVPDEDGYTALMVAAGLGRTLVVEALLGAGADATVEDGYGTTALQYAAESGRTPTDQQGS